MVIALGHPAESPGRLPRKEIDEILTIISWPAIRARRASRSGRPEPHRLSPGGRVGSLSCFGPPPLPRAMRRSTRTPAIFGHAPIRL